MIDYFASVVANILISIVAEQFILLNLILKRYSLHGRGKFLHVLPVKPFVSLIWAHQIFVGERIEVVIMGLQLRALSHIPLHRPVN